MDIHVLTPRGAELVVQVVDGRVIMPPRAVEDGCVCTIEANSTQAGQGLTSRSKSQ